MYREALQIVRFSIQILLIPIVKSTRTDVTVQSKSNTSVRVKFFFLEFCIENNLAIKLLDTIFTHFNH